MPASGITDFTAASCKKTSSAVAERGDRLAIDIWAEKWRGCYAPFGAGNGA